MSIESRAIKALEDILAIDSGDFYKDNLKVYRVAQDALIDIKEQQLKQQKEKHDSE